MLDVSKPKTYNSYDAPHQDLREFVARIEASGELLRVPGAHWDLEMGALAEIVYHTRPEPPAILFEDVPGYPRGMRLLSGATIIPQNDLPLRSGCRYPAIRSRWCAPIATA
jgi:hypothetical protein